jgi:hypothetical protein
MREAEQVHFTKHTYTRSMGGTPGWCVCMCVCVCVCVWCWLQLGRTRWQGTCKKKDARMHACTRMQSGANGKREVVVEGVDDRTAGLLCLDTDAGSRTSAPVSVLRGDRCTLRC